MKLTIPFLLVALCAVGAQAQANPNPAISRPLVCKKGGDVGPAGTCVPFDPNNPEHRRLLEKMAQPSPDIRSAPPMQSPPAPAPVTSIGQTSFQTPPLFIYQPLVPKPPDETAPEPYCDLACSQTKLHQFDSPSAKPGQAPPGAGALWGATHALRERQERSRQMRSQQQDAQLQDAQLQDALRTEAFVADMLALRMDISFVRANSSPRMSPEPGMRPEDIQIFEDEECRGHKNGDRIENLFDHTFWVCYESVADGDVHATELNLPAGGAADLRRWTKGFTEEQMQELRGRVCQRPHSDYIDKLVCNRK